MYLILGVIDFRHRILNPYLMGGWLILSRLLTFMAYSWPSSCPLVFLTRNTFP